MHQKRKYTLDNTSKKALNHWYYLMTLGRQIDNKAPNYLKQALGWSYHAPYAGHDGIQLAIGQHFDKDSDFLFPYYRDMLTAISAGLTPEEVMHSYSEEGGFLLSANERPIQLKKIQSWYKDKKLKERAEIPTPEIMANNPMPELLPIDTLIGAVQTEDSADSEKLQ